LKIGILLASLLYTSWLFAKYSIPNFSAWVRVGAFIGFGGLALDFMMHDILVRNWWLHYGVNDEQFGLMSFDDRPRGFSYESSTLGSTLMTFGLLAALTARKNMNRLAWLSGTGFALIFCGSKAAFLVFALSITFALVVPKTRRALLITPVSVAIFLILGSLVAEQWLTDVFQSLLLPFILDIEQSTSIATRSTMILGAILNVIEFPFGVGFTGYIPALVAKIDSAAEISSQLLGMPINLWELESYQTQNSGFAISAKSFFFDQAVVFGMPFVLMWLWGHWFLLRRLWVHS